MDQTKNVLKSKINWLGLFVGCAGLLLTPEFQNLAQSLGLDPSLLGKLIAGAGFTTTALRTFATSTTLTIRKPKGLE